MDIEEYADILNLEIRLTYYPNQNGRWSADFVGIETKEGGMLSSSYGNGSNPLMAIENFLHNIVGKRIVINAYGSNRREYDVPKTLTTKEPTPS